MIRWPRIDVEPETRVGHCCGCNPAGDLPLFKVAGIFRYRCSPCFIAETGRRHHLDFPPASTPTSNCHARNGIPNCISADRDAGFKP